MWLKPLTAVGAALCLGVVAMAPWAQRPPLVYEAVSGYPMNVYYRNIGDDIIKVVGAGGIPALSDEPLPAERIDAYFVEVKKQVQRADSLVKGGEYVRFVLDDPEGLAWKPDKIEHTTYFYLFAMVEMPRSAVFHDRWISELCLVSKTHEPFKRCPTHNDVYAGG